MGGRISQLPDEAGLPRTLAEGINEVFVASIGRTLSVNDSYGSPAMREIVLDEINGLRRYVLGLARRLLDGDQYQG